MRARLPWVLGTLAIVLVLTGVSAMTVALWTEPAALQWIIVFALLGLIATTTGAVVAARVPSNAVGWLLLGLGAGVGVMALSVAYSVLSFDRGFGPLLADEYVAWLPSWIGVPAFYGTTVFLLLLFPDGRLPSSRWRPVAWFCVVGLTLATVAAAFAPVEPSPGVDNPLAPSGSAGKFFGWLYDASDWLAPPIMGSAAAALIVRFRRSRGVERQQLKWFTYAASIAGAALGISVVIPGEISDLAFLAGLFALAGLPVATGMAVLRYRLYDIDVVINRTLVYGVLTALLAGTYLGSVLLLQLLLAPLTQQSELAVAGSTLAVAALFRPARARIQAVVDRRFYRRRYDAARTLEGFGAHLRDELDLGTLAADLRDVVRTTMQPAHVSLWLREHGRNDSWTARP